MLLEARPAKGIQCLLSGNKGMRMSHCFVLELKRRLFGSSLFCKLIKNYTAVDEFQL
jgi:hypothetical protein